MARATMVHRLRRDLVLVAGNSPPDVEARRLERHEVSRVRLALQGRADVLSEVHAALGGRKLGASADRMWRDVQAALQSGRLVAYEVPSHAIRVGAPGEELLVEAPRVEREETTWIGIELVDQEGEPLAYQRVRIVLPNGEPRDLMLDEHGRLQLAGIDPGTCEVTFPDLDGRDWHPA